jgi:hypothetical protein
MYRVFSIKYSELCPEARALLIKLKERRTALPYVIYDEEGCDQAGEEPGEEEGEALMNYFETRKLITLRQLDDLEWYKYESAAGMGRFDLGDDDADPSPVSELGGASPVPELPSDNEDNDDNAESAPATSAPPAPPAAVPRAAAALPRAAAALLDLAAAALPRAAVPPAPDGPAAAPPGPADAPPGPAAAPPGPAAAPPAPDAPATEPTAPATEQPAFDAPTTEQPATEPPATEPPAPASDLVPRLTAKSGKQLLDKRAALAGLHATAKAAAARGALPMPSFFGTKDLPEVLAPAGKYTRTKGKRTKAPSKARTAGIKEVSKPASEVSKPASEVTKPASGATTTMTGGKWARIARADEQDTLLRRLPQTGVPGCEKTFYKSFVSPGDTVCTGTEVVADDKTWVFVTKGSKSGFVNKDYIKYEPTEETEDADADDEEDEYEIDEVIKEKTTGRGAKKRTLYLVKWVGWADQPTWEPMEHLEGVPQFEAYVESKAAGKKRGAAGGTKSTGKKAAAAAAPRPKRQKAAETTAAAAAIAADEASSSDSDSDSDSSSSSDDDDDA